ncbi:MAG: 23S rRNA (adenine(2503)-C(2))-methyltransferase RlmN [Clostridia bacterium]|nr:23S rRNA (adenine(2503)-C(2))-methyltransferase RlmN [Clostridia bacterium]
MQTLLGKNPQELKESLTQMGEPGYRAGQLSKWLYQNVPFESMSDLPASLREKLRRETSEGYLKMLEKRTAADGTTKYLFELPDGNTVETVFLPKEYGNSVCVSSQVGCAMGCRFCASTKDGLVRNLSAGEMLAQITAVAADQRDAGRIGNVVVMGMGEPLANEENLVRFVRLASSPEGLGISQRALTVSTCGLIPAIRRLAEEDLQITLAVSLHSARQDEREKLMPSARANPLPELIQAAREYFEKTGRRVTFEYALIDGVNDTDADLDALTDLLGGFPCHVNIIPLNASGSLAAPSKRRVYAFAEALGRRGISATVRRSMGSDIEGACGQLRQRRLAQD